jgi:hypothetical protein
MNRKTTLDHSIQPIRQLQPLFLFDPHRADRPRGDSVVLAAAHLMKRMMTRLKAGHRRRSPSSVPAVLILLCWPAAWIEGG